MTVQVLVAFTMYLEAAALIPQLWLVRKMEDVEALTSNYVGILIIARAVRMIFWVIMFFDGQKFICLFTADVLHTALSADYLYLWVRKLRHGGRLIYSL
jgi:ER lumen protein retaining receptor